MDKDTVKASEQIAKLLDKYEAQILDLQEKLWSTKTDAADNGENVGIWKGQMHMCYAIVKDLKELLKQI